MNSFKVQPLKLLLRGLQVSKIFHQPLEWLWIYCMFTMPLENIITKIWMCLIGLLTKLEFLDSFKDRVVSSWSFSLLSINWILSPKKRGETSSVRIYLKIHSLHTKLFQMRIDLRFRKWVMKWLIWFWWLKDLKLQNSNWTKMLHVTLETGSHLQNTIFWIFFSSFKMELSNTTCCTSVSLCLDSSLLTFSTRSIYLT